MNSQLPRWVVICSACLCLVSACGDDDDSGNKSDAATPDGGADSGASEGGGGSGGSISSHGGEDGGGGSGGNTSMPDAGEVLGTGDACAEDGDCESAHCVGGTCCKSACDEPPACMTAKGATCDDGSHCKYGKLANGTDCDDGDACTSGESCKDGKCDGGKSKECKAKDDCHTASCDPDSGDCLTKQVKNGTACDDGLSCTANETCTDGECKDSDAKSACLEGATACSEANDRTCTCDALYLLDATSHTCQPDLCAMDPCGAHATCTTPGGVRTCTCDEGWTGNPDGAAGCPCTTGQALVNNQCVCDLSGAFALRIKAMESWAASPGFKMSGPVPAYTWAIRKQTYSSDGTLQTTQIPCGGSAPVVCGDSFFPNQAWGGFDDYREWGTMNTPGAFQTSSSTASIPNALASQPFQPPLEAILSGIHMAHPLTDAWPANASAVGDAYSAANPNKPYWVDDDQDGQPGVASYFIPPDALNPDTLPHTGGARAAVNATGIGPDNTCGAGYNWAYPPGQCNMAGTCITKVKAAFQGTRAILQYDGTINSCDDITGTVYGPPSPLGCNTAASGGNCTCGGTGQARCGFLSGGRVVGCWRGTDANETLCGDASDPTSPAHFLDIGNGEAPESTDTTFHIKRVPANMLTNGDLTCETVRALLPRD